jgi:hypothetical protein
MNNGSLPLPLSLVPVLLAPAVDRSVTVSGTSVSAGRDVVAGFSRPRKSAASEEKIPSRKSCDGREYWTATCVELSNESTCASAYTSSNASVHP